MDTATFQPSVLAIVMAGGKGERLFPLTKERSKPAVPFAGKYRVVDFALSNLMNSKITACYVLVQYRSQSLIEHLRICWPSRGLTSREFLTVVPPQMLAGETWYRGTADAVTQNINLIKDSRSELVAVFSADHVYRMDVRQMIAFHALKKAEVTMAAVPFPLDQAQRLGVLEVNREGRAVGFEEKPKKPKAMPGQSGHALVSMGNYIFNREALIAILEDEKRQQGAYDFGKSIFPNLIPRHNVYVYDFKTNRIPGADEHEAPWYWRDVGTLEDYWRAHMDLLGEKPVLRLDNSQWPILGSHFEGPAGRFLSARVENSLIADGCLIKKARITRSVLGRGVRILEKAQIEDSIIMDHVTIGKNSRLKRVIVDRFNIIADYEQIGFEPEKDSRRYFVSPSGLTVLPRARR
ncbi:MAG: glucose-1-phosphate adenylyltransferase [Elusimicrobia bacterium]|nr:glucose-1-phosphate adenylyltransferase [Elusimicrobiota bacterium]